MLRGDTALWILTKMAMLFFIMSLAGILLLFSSTQRTSLCKANAQQVADSIGGTLASVMQSPLEDERRVLKLPSALAIGEGSASRYEIELDKYAVDGQSSRLIIDVKSLSDPSCTAGKSVLYPRAFDPSNPPKPGERKQMNLAPLAGRTVHPAPWPSKLIEGIVLYPSPNTAGVDYADRSNFVGILKCTEKTLSRREFYYIQDCPASGCVDLAYGQTPLPGVTQDAIKSNCGFNNAAGGT